MHYKLAFFFFLCSEIRVFEGDGGGALSRSTTIIKLEMTQSCGFHNFLSTSVQLLMRVFNVAMSLCQLR